MSRSPHRSRARRRGSRLSIVALLACGICLSLAPAAGADFTESEDSPFQDPDASEDDPLAGAEPVPWDGATFSSAFPSGVKLVRGTLDVGDVDAYAFSLEAGQLVLGALFEGDAGERHDTSLGIFTGGTLPAHAVDDDGGSGFLSRFTFATTSATVHQVAVTGFGDEDYDGDHLEARDGLVPYWLVVAATTDPPPNEEIEDNDSWLSATPLPPGGGVVGATLDAGDVDTFSIALEAGDRLAISLFDLENAGERNDAILGLFDPVGSPAAAGLDDDGGPGLMSNLLFTADTDGTWTIAVSGFGDDGFSGDHQEVPFDYLLVVARERACPNVTPLISNIVASTANPYQTAELRGGDHYYTDRNEAGRHLLVDIPPAHLCSEWIKTANNDKNVADPNHLSFNVSQAASVFIGYDSRATGEPAWLASAFTPLADVLDVADPDTTQEFVLLRRDFAPGPVTLGGNLAPGAGSNYVVFARPLPVDDPGQAFSVPEYASAVTLTVSGVEIQVVRAPGQSSEGFAQAIANAVNADPTLAAARIYGLASGAVFVTTGTIDASSTTASLPLLPVSGLVLLAGLLLGVGYRRSR